MVEISVLMPIHNGADFLSETLEALRRQDFDPFEVLCIDDCSTDDSAEIVQGIARDDPRFVYLNTGKNLGAAAKAINFARDRVRGARFVYSSQDDLFSEDWLSSLHTRATETGADAVIPIVEFYRDGDANPRRITGLDGDLGAVISGREAFRASLDWSIAGNALWPTEFLKHTGFFDFGAFADEYTVRHFFLRCEKVAFSEGLFFYRQDNAGAITKKVSARRLDEARNSAMVWQMIAENGFDASTEAEFALRTLRSVIRVRGMVFNAPALSAEAARVDAVWRDLQTDRFHAALDAGLRQKGRGPLSPLYRRAGRSLRWYLTLARLSGRVARMRGKH